MWQLYIKYGKISFMDKNKSISTQKINRWDVGYFILYGIVLAKCVYETTMFSQQVLVGTFKLFLAAMVLYTGAKVLFSGYYSRKEQLAIAVVVLIFGIVGLQTGYYELLQPVLLIAGAKNVRFDNILKVYTAVVSVMLIVAAIASQTGVIADVIGYSPRNAATARHSYGIIYPTDFAAHIFYLILAVSCLGIWQRVQENEKYRYPAGLRWLIVIAAGVFIYIKAGAFTGTVCLTGFLVLTGLIYLLERKNLARRVCEIFKYLPIVWAGLFLALSYFYSASNAVMVKIDTVLSQRLMVSHKVWSEYSIKAFGQFIEEQGWGGIADPTGIDPAKYFFIDDMYLRMLFEYGIIVFAVVLILLIVIGHRAIGAKQYVLFAAIVMIGVHSFMEHHLLEVAYDPFLLVLLAGIDTADKEKSGRKI
jgi:hypothetical protein